MAQALGAMAGQLLGSYLNGSFSSGGGTDYKGTLSLMKTQNDYWRNNTKWINEEGWKFLRQGLINADYNPLLAIGTSPQQGYAPTAQATNDTRSASFDGASAMQANTARKVSESQIQVNKATANKTAEEALTQSNVRNNLDSQSLLNLLSSERIQKLLPYEEQKFIADVAVANSIVNLNDVTAKNIPEQTKAHMISANASKTTAEFNKEWTPKQLGYTLGAGLLGLAPLGIGKLKSLFKRPVGFR